MTLQTDPEGAETKALHQLVDFVGKRALEIGCGDGRLTWRYADEATAVIGIDINVDDLRVAVIDRPADLVERAHFIHADAVQLPIDSETFDLAIFSRSF